MTATGAMVWNGNESLRQFLVPIDSLEPFPGNPRRGDVAQIRGMLRRFGQVVPIVVDGTRITKGHHVRLAAIEEGWTHVAALPHQFGDEDEQRAFLIGDNRSSELGSVDAAMLVDHLKILADLDKLVGTGYDHSDLDRYLADLDDIAGTVTPPPELPQPRPPAHTVDMVEVVLVYPKQQRNDLERWLQIVAKERGTNGPSEAVYEAAKLAATQLNQEG